MTQNVRDNLIQLPPSLDKEPQAQGTPDVSTATYQTETRALSPASWASALGPVIHFCTIAMILSYLRTICTFINMVPLTLELTLLYS